MTTSTIAQAVAEKLGVSKRAGLKVVKAVVGAIASALADGGRVRLSGFGTFKVVERQKRVCKAFGKTVEVPPHKAVKFKPSIALKKKLNA
ncbi:MAG: HU family DNA-binding protein [Elusimicrobiales bacterium]